MVADENRPATGTPAIQAGIAQLLARKQPLDVPETVAQYSLKDGT